MSDNPWVPCATRLPTLDDMTTEHYRKHRVIFCDVTVEVVHSGFAGRTGKVTRHITESYWMDGKWRRDNLSSAWGIEDDIGMDMDEVRVVSWREHIRPDPDTQTL